jgi:hypothetical protein
LINNRQGGRRRGRGGQRGQNPGGPSGNNRQDTRQRGNAAQLLEKYKSMARDAQLAGDRVQTEYYLQFADHYYRVLGESRARFEEQNPRRQRDDEGDEDGDSGSYNDAGFQQGDEELSDDGGDNGADEREVRAERAERNEPRKERGERFPRRDRPRRDESERSAASDDEPRHVNGGGETIPFDILPPAIGRDESAAEEVSDEQPRRRRRTRAPRDADEGESEIAPAA